VYVSGVLAPSGTTVAAYVNGSLAASTTANSSGKYGYTTLFLVPGASGGTVTFYVGGTLVPQTATWSSGGFSRLDLYSTGPGGLTITCPQSTGTVGVVYSSNIGATGGTSPYTCSIISGSLPPGLTRTACTISGMPTDNGTYNFTIQVTDSASPPNTVTQPCSITIGTSTEKLVGIATTGPFGGYAEANQFFVAPFTAEGSGSMTKFRIYCASSGNVKVAIYDSTGALLNKVDTATVVSGVNTITFPATSITAGSIYQLAAVSDTLIGLDSGSYHLYKTQTFTGFTFPTTLPSDFKRYDSRVPIFAGYK
jgi:hypothetical protein